MNKFFAATALLLLIWGCSFLSKSEQKPAVAPIVHTIIFIDKTQSVNVNERFVAQKYQQAIRDLVQNNIRQAGDQLEVYFIHENTSKARALSLTCRSELENAAQNLSPTDREAAQTAFEMALKREQTMFLSQSLAKLNQQNGGSSNQMTDIWASLPVVAKASENGAEVKVYYLSDMIESMRGAERRDFHKQGPQTNDQAQEWAKTDAQKLKENNLNAAQIKILLPFEPTASTRENNPTVTLYWKTLFQELGAGNIEEL